MFTLVANPVEEQNGTSFLNSVLLLICEFFVFYFQYFSWEGSELCLEIDADAVSH